MTTTNDNTSAASGLSAAAGSGIALIAAERQRQIKSEGWTPDHDDKHFGGELSAAAQCYTMLESYRVKYPKYHDARKATPPPEWPWELQWWKPSEDPVRNLVKAGALIAAEIDRLQRFQNDPIQP